MEDMAVYSDRVVVMSNGRVYMEGETGEIFTRAGELKSVGLDVPQITKLINILRKNGIALDGDIYTVEKARAAVVALLEEKKLQKKGN